MEEKDRKKKEESTEMKSEDKEGGNKEVEDKDRKKKEESTEMESEVRKDKMNCEERLMS